MLYEIIVKYVQKLNDILNKYHTEYATSKPVCVMRMKRIVIYVRDVRFSY